VFSITPLLVIAIAIAGLAFGNEAAQGQIVDSFKDLIGQSGADTIQTMIQHAQKPTAGIIATVVGVVVLVFGASGVFVELQSSLNDIWDVKIDPKSGWKAMIKRRFLDFGMVLGIGFLLMVSLVLSAALTSAGKFMSEKFPGGPVLWQVVNFLVSLGVITALFSMIFKILPDVKLRWKDVIAGALLTAVLFVIGKTLIGLYIGNSSMASVYGAAGSFVVMLVWIYYSAQILLFGAEFTEVYAKRFGSRYIEPANNAISIEQARAGRKR
jgi:membrane protein